MHKGYKYSVTIHTDDLAVLGCLRALSQHAQATGNVRIPWGGTKKKDWINYNHHATFHFSLEEYRNEFLKHSQRLLAADLWSITKRSDNDPASPQ